MCSLFNAYFPVQGLSKGKVCMCMRIAQERNVLCQCTTIFSAKSPIDFSTIGCHGANFKQDKVCISWREKTGSLSLGHRWVLHINPLGIFYLVIKVRRDLLRTYFLILTGFSPAINKVGGEVTLQFPHYCQVFWVFEFKAVGFVPSWDNGTWFE